MIFCDTLSREIKESTNALRRPRGSDIGRQTVYRPVQHEFPAASTRRSLKFTRKNFEDNYAERVQLALGIESSRTLCVEWTHISGGAVPIDINIKSTWEIKLQVKVIIPYTSGGFNASPLAILGYVLGKAVKKR
jgi:hypothetical protein